MKWLMLLLILVLAVTVQTTLSGYLAIGRARPDFIIAFAVFLALQFDLREVFIPIWGLGIFRDVFSFGPIGLYGLIFLALGIIVGYVRAYAFRDNFLILIATVVTVVVLCELTANVALSIRYPMLNSTDLFADSLLAGFYTSLVVILLPRVLYRPCRKLGFGRLY